MLTALRLLSMITLLTALNACGKSDSVEEHLARGHQLIAGSDYDSAVIELKNALQKDNQTAQARWLLGKIYLDSGDVLSAEKELERAARLGWSQDDVMPAMAKSLLAQGKFAQIADLQETGLQQQPAANLLATKALAAMALGENKKAGKLVNKALDKDPESTDALLANARILASQGDLTGAQAALEALIALHPANDTAWALSGDLHMARQQPNKALLAYNRAIDAQPKNYAAQFERALLSLQLKDYAAAQADADTLLAVAPQSPGANYVKGLIDFQAGRYEEAISALSVAEPTFKQYPLILLFLGSAQLITGHLDQASIQATRFHGIAPESIRGRKLLATIRLQQGKHKEVQDLLQPVLDANPDDVGALNLMANALLRDGKTDEGITALSRVAALQPDSPVAQVRLGAGLLMGGQGDAAAQHIETALELNPEFQQADILLVMNHMQKQDYDAAIDAAKGYRRRNLTSTTPLNLLGRVYQAADQQDKAKASFEKTLKLDAGDPTANHNLAQMAVANEDLDSARQYYAALLEYHKNYLPALLQLARLDAKEQKEEALIGHLEQAMKAHPSAIEPRLLMGRYYMSTGGPEKVAPLFANLEELQKQSPQVLQLMAQAQLSKNEHEDAQFTLEQLIESSPDSAAVHHLMAMAAAGSNDNKRAEQELRRALALNKNYLPSRIALARLALTKGWDDEFNQHIRQLQTHAPQNPDVLLLRAASISRQGDTAAATKFAEQAFAVAPSTSTAQALGSYKEASGDREGALELYRTWIDENPDDIAVRMVIANSLQLAQMPGEASVYYEQALQLDPNNVVALNNLAWHMRERNAGKALQYARRATTLTPESADALDTLAVVQYINEDYKQAGRSIERALQQNPGHPSLLYHSAMIAAAAGDSTSAYVILDKLLTSDNNFAEATEATELLLSLNKQP